MQTHLCSSVPRIEGTSCGQQKKSPSKFIGLYTELRNSQKDNKFISVTRVQFSTQINTVFSRHQAGSVAYCCLKYIFFKTWVVFYSKICIFLSSKDINWKCGKEKDPSLLTIKAPRLDKLAGCKRSAGFEGYSTLMLSVDRAVIKFSAADYYKIYKCS